MTTDPTPAPYDAGDAPTSRTYRPVPTMAERTATATALPATINAEPRNSPAEGDREDRPATEAHRAAEADRRAVAALAAARNALEHAPKTCRYHGDDFDRNDTRIGLPRCESCHQPYRVTRALAALDVAEREG